MRHRSICTTVEIGVPNPIWKRLASLIFFIKYTAGILMKKANKNSVTTPIKITYKTEKYSS